MVAALLLKKLKPSKYKITVLFQRCVPGLQN
jgi:hypothetical protein